MEANLERHLGLWQCEVERLPQRCARDGAGRHVKCVLLFNDRYREGTWRPTRGAGGLEGDDRLNYGICP